MPRSRHGPRSKSPSPSLGRPAIVAQRPISDICLIVEDLAAMIEFYRDRLGFALRRRAPGFADFATAGVTLALWEREHMAEHTGIPALHAPAGARKSMNAIETPSLAAVATLHQELEARGVVFLAAPRLYPWNAYACYFEDPESNLWEIYAWGEEGHAGLLPI